MPQVATPLEVLLDVRAIPPFERHRLIFGTFERLRAGEGLLIVNDHNPLPLSARFDARYPGRFSWTYLQRGPDVWRVRIGCTH
jgi:uncharacterized protein (DUF2249 family)